MMKLEYLSLLEKEFFETLEEAFKAGDPAGELAQKAANLHKKWLTFYWDNYNKEAHAGLVQRKYYFFHILFYFFCFIFII